MKIDGKNLSEQLRSALRTCGHSFYEISRATEIDEGTLSKFASGKVGLRLRSIDVLGRFLGLKIAQRE